VGDRRGHRHASTREPRAHDRASARHLRRPRRRRRHDRQQPGSRGTRSPSSSTTDGATPPVPARSSAPSRTPRRSSARSTSCSQPEPAASGRLDRKASGSIPAAAGRSRGHPPARLAPAGSTDPRSYSCRVRSRAIAVLGPLFLFAERTHVRDTSCSAAAPAIAGERRRARSRGPMAQRPVPRRGPDAARWRRIAGGKPFGFASPARPPSGKEVSIGTSRKVAVNRLRLNGPCVPHLWMHPLGARRVRFLRGMPSKLRAARPEASRTNRASPQRAAGAVRRAQCRVRGAVRSASRWSGADRRWPACGAHDMYAELREIAARRRARAVLARRRRGEHTRWGSRR
jgi:hypothetical protein